MYGPKVNLILYPCLYVLIELSIPPVPDPWGRNPIRGIREEGKKVIRQCKMNFHEVLYDHDYGWVIGVGVPTGQSTLPV